MNAAIDLQSISKRFGKVQALDDVTFSVPEGSLFGLIGPDGAGKSTLYKILTSLLSADSGKAFVDGMDTVDESKKIRAEIGYMPQQFSLYTDLSVSENLHFFASLYGVSVRENYDLIAPFFDQLAKIPTRRAGALSGGMKQKLALGCALIHRPKILLLDEPTTGVDAVSRSEFWDMLTSLKQKGITILVSTSYMDEAQRCDKIALISNGRILKVDAPCALTADIGETLYNACAREMYPLLLALRNMPDIKKCYTFGDTLHIVAGTGFDPEIAARRLSDSGLSDVRIYPAKGNIEDLFIKLADNG